MRPVPQNRIHPHNSLPLAADGEFVVYWMHAQRRLGWNFALQRAVELSNERGKPMLILEALRCDYPWASERHHAFLLQGMREHAAILGGRPVGYFPYLERERGEGKGLLAALARRAVCVVTDEHPGFFHPAMVRAAASQVTVAMEGVDSCGIVPLDQPDRAFPTAHSFRRWLQKELREPLREFPLADPLQSMDAPRFEFDLRGIEDRWPRWDPDEPLGRVLESLPIDHEVGRVEGVEGGTRAARERLERFLESGLPRYRDDRNQPQLEVTSGLSPYLHHGHISAHEILSRIADKERWNFSRISEETVGAREGWWGMSPEAEAFLDQLVTWRELGFNAARHLADYDRYESLPDWALRTLSEHVQDERPHLYSREELEGGATHDPLWNASQNQLRREGEIHNYLRMLWGKKILEWSATPREALETMVHLNDKYALDGRDPNSVSGIFWILGRYDRAWGPERDIFGKIRYMSSENTARKVRVKEYVENHGCESLV